MSSERHARNMPVESPRFPGEGSSTQGKSGPKARAEAVADGRQVEIPVLRCDRTAGTHFQRLTADGIRGESGKAGMG